MSAYADAAAVLGGWRWTEARPPRRSFRARRVVVATCLLALADAMTTVAGLHLGHFTEVNPFMALALVDGIPGFLAAKGLLTALWATLAWFIRRRWFDLVNGGIMIAYSIVVVRSTAHLAAFVF